MKKEIIKKILTKFKLYVIINLSLKYLRSKLWKKYVELVSISYKQKLMVHFANILLNFFGTKVNYNDKGNFKSGLSDEFYEKYFTC